MRRFALLPVLLGTLIGAPPALAWTWPVDGPVLRAFSFDGDPYGPGLHRGVDVGGIHGSSVRAPNLRANPASCWVASLTSRTCCGIIPVACDALRKNFSPIQAVE